MRKSPRTERDRATRGLPQRKRRAGRGSADKPTAERLLDVAEQEFAARGYAAASLVEIAGQVGIRAPSLYSHYRSKEALYLAVVERLLGHFVPLTTGMLPEAVTRERVLEWLRQYVARHFEHPNLARILQHAALDGGPDTAGITQRLLGPMFREDASKIASASLKVLDERLLQGWAVMALNNMVMSYITMAPLYEGLIGADPFSTASRRKQEEIVVMLVAAAMDLDDRG